MTRTWQLASSVPLKPVTFLAYPDASGASVALLRSVVESARALGRTLETGALAAVRTDGSGLPFDPSLFQVEFVERSDSDAAGADAAMWEVINTTDAGNQPVSIIVMQQSLKTIYLAGFADALVALFKQHGCRQLTVVSSADVKSGKQHQQQMGQSRNPILFASRLTANGTSPLIQSSMDFGFVAELRAEECADWLVQYLAEIAPLSNLDLALVVLACKRGIRHSSESFEKDLAILERIFVASFGLPVSLHLAREHPVRVRSAAHRSGLKNISGKSVEPEDNMMYM